MEEVNFSLSTNELILHVENPEDFIKKLLELINSVQL